MIRMLSIVWIFVLFVAQSVFADNTLFETELSKLPPNINDATVIEQYIDFLGKYGKNQPDNALQISKKIVNVAKHLNYPIGANRALFAKGKFELILNKQDEALMSYMNALKGARQMKDTKLIVDLLSDIAQLYYRKSDFVLALEYLQETLKIAKENNYWSKVATALNNMAIIYFEYGENRKALALFRESQTIAKSVNDSFGEANSYIGIGNVYFEMKDYPQAELAYKNAVSKFKKSPATLAPLSIAYSNLADVYKHLNQRDSTIYYLKLCHQTAIKHYDPESKALALQYLSEEYLYKKDFEKALEYAEIAKKEYLQLNNHLELTAIYLLKSKMYKAMNNYNQAIRPADSAEVIARKFNLKSVQLKSLDALAELYYLSNEFKKSAEYYKRIIVINDSIMSKDNIKSIRNQILQYELKVQSKEQEMLNKERNIIELSDTNSKLWFYIALCLVVFVLVGLFMFYYYRKFRNMKIEEIKSKNIIIEKKNQELFDKSKQIEYQLEILKADNSSKEKLFSVIAHDLKNPLTVIMTSAELVLSYYEKLPKEQILAYLQKIVDASVKMNGLLYNLLDWVMSQQGKIIPNKGKVSINELVESAISLVQTNASTKNISFNSVLINDFTVFVDANMVKTVLRNVLTNAVKFSNNNAEISIKSVRIKNKEHNGIDSAKIHLIIEDYGIGIAPEMLKNLFSYYRYNSTYNNLSESGSGLGLIISKDFMEKNNGKIVVDSKFGEGTKVILEFAEFNTQK